MWEKSFVGRHVKAKCPTVLGEYVLQDILFHLSPSNQVIWAMKTTITNNKKEKSESKEGKANSSGERRAGVSQLFCFKKGKRTIKVEKLKSDSPVK